MAYDICYSILIPRKKPQDKYLFNEVLSIRNMQSENYFPTGFFFLLNVFRCFPSSNFFSIDVKYHYKNIIKSTDVYFYYFLFN